MFEQIIILSIYKEDVDNLYMKSIVNNFIKNGDVKLYNPVYNRFGIPIHHIIHSPVLLVTDAFYNKLSVDL